MRLRPVVTAVVAGGLAGLVAVLTYEAMIGLQRLIWLGDDGDPLRTMVTIIAGGGLLLLLGRIAPSESMEELLRDADKPLARSRRRIGVTALVAVVSIAFGGAIGPEAGLLAVVAECSVLVSRFVAQDEAHAIAQAGNAGALSGLYGSPPAMAILDEGSPAPSRLMSFVAGISGFGVFLLIARTVFGGEGVATVPLPAPEPGAAWLVIVPILVGVAFGIGFRVLHAAMKGLSARIRHRWIVTTVGTFLFAGIAALIPLVRFSGHHELGDVVSIHADGRAGELWVLAVAKLLAVVVCLASGWRGGEVFPLLFVGAAAGAATALSVPGIDPAAATAGAMAAALAVGWRRPLAALLILVLVTEPGVALPLVLGTGIGAVLDRVLFPTRSGDDGPDVPVSTPGRTDGADGERPDRRTR